MGMKLPGERTLEEHIVGLVIRWPGLRSSQIIHRVSRRVNATKRTLARMVEQQILEKRPVTDPDHENYGLVGYFWVNRHPL